MKKFNYYLSSYKKSIKKILFLSFLFYYISFTIWIQFQKRKFENKNLYYFHQSFRINIYLYSSNKKSLKNLRWTCSKIVFILIYFIILKYILFFYYFIIIKNTDSSNNKKLIQKSKHFIAFLSFMLYNDFEY